VCVSEGVCLYIDELRCVTSIDGGNVFTVVRAVNRRPILTPKLRVHSLLDPSAVSVWFVRYNMSTFPAVYFYSHLHIDFAKCCTRNIPSYNRTINAIYSTWIKKYSQHKEYAT
jgi:hypothetical protein